MNFIVHRVKTDLFSNFSSSFKGNLRGSNELTPPAIIILGVEKLYSYLF